MEISLGGGLGMGGGETQELERLGVPKNAVVGIKDIQTDLR